MNLDFLDRFFTRTHIPRRKRHEMTPKKTGMILNWHNLRADYATDEEVARAIKNVATHYADGIYYVDKRLPNIIADQGAMVPTTTMKNIWANGATNPCILPANYWTAGKTQRLTANIKLTTGTA